MMKESQGRQPIVSPCPTSVSPIRMTSYYTRILAGTQPTCSKLCSIFSGLLSQENVYIFKRNGSLVWLNENYKLLGHGATKSRQTGPWCYPVEWAGLALRLLSHSTSSVVLGTCACLLLSPLVSSACLLLIFVLPYQFLVGSLGEMEDGATVALRIHWILNLVLYLWSQTSTWF